MKSFFQNVIFLLLILYCVYCKVVGVAEMFRHGARAPDNFAHKGDKFFFDSSRRMLTINGIRQHILLGKWMRERYVINELNDGMMIDDEDLKFLPSKYNQDFFELLTTQTQRTIFSLAGQMEGMYPNVILTPTFKENSLLKFHQNPPLKRFNLRAYNDKGEFSITERKNPVIGTWKCKLPGSSKYLRNELKKVDIFPFTEEILDKMLEFYKIRFPYLFDHSHQKQNKFNSVLKIIDYIRCLRFATDNQLENLQFPEDQSMLLNKFVINKLYSTRLPEENNQLIKMFVTGLLRKIGEFFEGKVKGGNDKRKMLWFSGHNTNLIDMLTNLLDHNYLRKLIEQAIDNKDNQAYRFLNPFFASSILFELHEMKGSHYVRILYNGEELKDNFIIKGISYLEKKGIPLDQFNTLINSRINDEIDNLKC